MKPYLLIFFLIGSQFASGQKIINAAMVGDNGITDDVKKATYLIVIKSYQDTAFERLEYNFTGPIKRRLTFKDPLLKTLHGTFATFSPTGYIFMKGNYSDNKKEGSWYEFDDTAKAVKEYKYHLDTLLAVVDLDSVFAERKKEKHDTTGEVEAVYNGGMKKYINFIYKNLKIPERTTSLEAGGTVRVRFVVDKSGAVTDVHIIKSVEFAFDEEAMRVISSAKDWIPAEQRGRKVNAYREQPISISFK